MREIYSSFSTNYFKQSLWFTHIALFVIVISLLWNIPFALWILAPIVIICLLSAVKYLIYEQKNTAEAVNTEANTGTLLNDFIVLNEGTSVYLFTPSGEKNYEIRNRGKNVISFYNKNQIPIYSLNKETKGSSLISISNDKSQQVAVYKEDDKKSWIHFNGKLIVHEETFMIEKKHHNRFVLKKETGEAVVTVQKGWMPTQWQKRFPLNSPTITFELRTSPKNKEVLLFMIGYIFLQK